MATPRVLTDTHALPQATVASSASLHDLSSPTIGSVPLIPGELYTLLTKLPFFAGVAETDSFLHEICKTMYVRKHSPGDIVIRQGDVARAMFFILKGSLKVVSEDGEIDFGELTQGTIFGEIGILFDIKRTATVVAKTYCTLVTLLSDVVHKKLAFYPEIERVMKSAAQDRLALMSQELQRAGRQPPPELREKFLAELKDPLLVPEMHAASRRQSIRVDMTDLITHGMSEYEPRSRERTSERSSMDLDPGSSFGSAPDVNFEAPSPAISQVDTSALQFLELQSPEPEEQVSDIQAQSTQAMLASRFDSRRRASVAVWSDDKLMKFAQNAVNHAAAKESRCKLVPLLNLNARLIRMHPKVSRGLHSMPPNLHTLSLSTVWDITETGLNSIAEHCKQLRAIDLSNCRKLNDAGVQNLLGQVQASGYDWIKLLQEYIRLHHGPIYLELRGVQPLGWSHPVINDVISENESELTDVRHGEQSLDANSMMDTDAPQSEIDTNHTQTTDAMDVTADGDHEPMAPGSHLPQDQPMHMSTYTEVPESLSNPIRLAFMLEELNLITDAGVDALLHESTRLAALNLSQCKSISQEAIHRASQVCELMTQQSFFEEIVFMPYVVANRRVRAATAPISHVYPKASHDLK
ncbi:hypothetical protein BASA81_011569 [Batrachochytrium salamandrivorans]|nr:hypothetical protein BASA81_011569 [Batrachochytrium salamandrivorans]